MLTIQVITSGQSILMEDHICRSGLFNFNVAPECISGWPMGYWLTAWREKLMLAAISSIAWWCVGKSWPNYPQNGHFHGDLDLWFLGPTWVNNPNQFIIEWAILLGSPVHPIHTNTHRQTILIIDLVLQCGLTIINVHKIMQYVSHIIISFIFILSI